MIENQPGLEAPAADIIAADAVVRRVEANLSGGQVDESPAARVAEKPASR
jgi:hypothetical protein